MGLAGLVADPGELVGGLAVIEPDRLHPDARRRRVERREQRRLERQQRVAVPRGPFGEQTHRPAAREGVADLGDLRLHAHPVAAFDEQGLVERAEPADQRHALQLGLGDEGRAGRAGDQQDVEPAQVIGHEHHVAGERTADDAGARAAQPRDRAEEHARPWGPRANEAPQAVQGEREEQREGDRKQAEGEADCAHRLRRPDAAKPRRRTGASPRRPGVRVSPPASLPMCAYASVLRLRLTPYSSIRWSTRRNPSFSAIAFCSSSSSGSTNSITRPVSTSIRWS